jgi:hypothetical protein
LCGGNAARKWHCTASQLIASRLNPRSGPPFLQRPNNGHVNSPFTIQW